MKRILLTPFIALLLLAGTAARAQTAPSANNQTPAQPSAAQSAEISEAVRLNASVIKLYGAGKYDEALPLAKQVLEIREKVSGPEHEATGGALLNLAEIYVAKKKYGEDEPLLRRAAAIYEKGAGGAEQKAAAVLERVALVHFARVYPGKAEESYRRALSLREKLGPEHKDVARPLAGLAEFYAIRGEYAKAEPLYQRLVAVLEKSRGAQSAELGEVMISFSCLLRKRGKKEEAQMMQERANAVLNKPVPDKSVEEKSGVLNGRAIVLERPEYPAEARSAGAQGDVVVQVLIDEKGNVARACALSGHPLLMQAAERAAYRSKFTPTTLSGQPVKVSGTISYKFVR